MEKEISKEQGKIKIKNMFLILAILAIVLFIVFMIQNVYTANLIKEQQEQEEYEEWLYENCECSEWGRLRCKEDFELVGKMCRNEEGKLFTHPLGDCSNYNCSGKMIIYDLMEEKWQKNQS